MSQREASEAAPGFGAARRDSYSRLAVADGLLAFTIIAVLAAGAGITDKLGDSLVLLAVATITGSIAIATRRTFVRRERPPTARVIAGLASTWASLVLAGSVVYLASGTITTVDEALFESAAGFSTVAATTLDPESLGTSMSLFRAGTQFVGGLVGLLAGVGGTASHNEGQRADPEGTWESSRPARP